MGDRCTIEMTSKMLFGQAAATALITYYAYHKFILIPFRLL